LQLQLQLQLLLRWRASLVHLCRLARPAGDGKACYHATR